MGKKIIAGKMYNTATAEAIADNEFSDGTNRLNHGRATTLYKSKKGNFFAEHETCWQGEHDTIEPLSIDQAKDLFQDLSGDADCWTEHFGAPEEA
jgi:hypothetical protein